MMILYFCLIYSLFFNLVYSDHSLVDDDELAYETTKSYLDDEFTNENKVLSNTHSIDLADIKSTEESIIKYKNGDKIWENLEIALYTNKTNFMNLKSIYDLNYFRPEFKTTFLLHGFASGYEQTEWYEVYKEFFSKMNTILLVNNQLKFI